MKLINIIKKWKSAFKEEKNAEHKYEIISHEENYHGSGRVYGKVRIKGLSKTFLKSARDLNTKEWLDDFPREDCAFIAVLALADQQKKLQ